MEKLKETPAGSTGPRHGHWISLADGDVEWGGAVTRHDTGTSRVWLIDPDDSGADPTIFEQLDNRSTSTWEIPLPWSALVQDRASGAFRALSSINGELPWYYAPQFPGLISTSLPFIAKRSGLNQPDPVSICSLLSIGWIVNGDSLVQGIRKTYGGSIVDLQEDGFTHREADVKTWLGLDDSIDDTRELVDAFTEACREALKNPQTQVCLTGGRDSRAILAAALSTGRPFRLQTGISPGVNPLDVDVPIQIAGALGLPHDMVDARSVTAPSGRAIHRWFALSFNGETDPTNAIIHHKEFVLAEDPPPKVTGWGGEIYLGLPSNYMKVLDLKLRGFEAEAVEAVKERIDSRLSEMKELSERDAVTLFHLRDKTMWATSSIARTYLAYFPTYAPYIDPRVLAVGYRLRGGAGCSGLHDALFRTLPTDVRDMRFDVGGGLRVHVFKAKRRLFPRLERSLLASADQLEGDIDASLFEGVLDAETIVAKVAGYASGKVKSATSLHKMLGVQYLFDSIAD